MFVLGMIHSLFREEIRSVYTEEIESAVMAFVMVGFTVSIFLSFTLAKIGEMFIGSRFISLLLLLPLIRSFFVERKYSGEVRNKTSIADEDVARLLEDF